MREAQEYFSEKQKGSSAMPHKKNPITSEQISGLARVLRGNAQAAFENIALWHERDISHSSVERVIFPDSTILVDYLLAKTTDLIDRLLVYPERMKKNLESHGRADFQRAIAAGSGRGRDDARGCVPAGAGARHAGVERGSAFSATKWRAIRRLQALLSPEKLAKTFDTTRQLGERGCDLSPRLGRIEPAKEPAVDAVQLTVAMTGASGAVFGRELLRALEADDRVSRVHFVASENSLRVMAEELGVSGRNDLLEKLLGAAPAKTVQLSDADIGAAIASGSHPSNGMIILPCSMGTLAAIANGLANSLIARAADVTLKERRPLLLCVRETPFNRIHLRNMTLAAEAGATIFPVIPAFYNQPVDSTEMARQFVCPRAGAYWLAAAGRLCVEGGRVSAASEQVTVDTHPCFH